MTLSKITKQKSSARASFVQKLNQAYEYAVLFSDKRDAAAPKPTLDNVIALMKIGEDVADEFEGVARLLTKADREKVGIVEEVYCAFDAATGYDWFLPQAGESVPGGILAAHNTMATMAEFYEIAKTLSALDKRGSIPIPPQFFHTPEHHERFIEYASTHAKQQAQIKEYQTFLQEKLSKGIVFDTTITYCPSSPAEFRDHRQGSISHRGNAPIVRKVPIGTQELRRWFTYESPECFVYTLSGTRDEPKMIMENLDYLTGVSKHDIQIRTPPDDCTSEYRATIRRNHSDELVIALDDSLICREDLPINPLLKGWIDYRKRQQENKQ